MATDPSFVFDGTETALELDRAKRLRAALKLRVAEAASMVVGEVVSVTGPVATEGKVLRSSEHDPQWSNATVAVASVLKGRASSSVKVVFTNSQDVMWYRAPKLAVGQHALPMLRTTAPGAHSLVSRFGTGSNCADAGTAPDAVLHFAAADSAETMTVVYPWNLPATSSTHLCLAVEVSTAQDPIVAPQPAWPRPGGPITDLLVINDNNKAQRNMGLGPTTLGGWFTRYALIHNATAFRRDIVLDWARVGSSKFESDDRLLLGGGRALAMRREGRLVVPGVAPGDCRWLRLTMFASGDDQRDAMVVFNEMVDQLAVNGFAIAAQMRPEDEVSVYLVGRALSVATRLEAFGYAEAAPLAKRAVMLLEEEVAARAFLDFVAEAVDLLSGLADELPCRLQRGGLSQLHQAHARGLESGGPPAALGAAGRARQGHGGCPR